MSKFSIVKEIAQRQSCEKNQAYELIKKLRREDLNSMAKEADEYLDRRRSRSRKNYSGKAPAIKYPKILMQPNYISVKEAAVFIGVSNSWLIRQINLKRISARKFNDPNNGLLKWYLSEKICAQLKQRKQNDLTLVEKREWI